MFKKVCMLLILLCMFSANGYASSLPNNPEDGAMLHTHTWSFKAVEENIPAIAAAGFNSVQVSPVQKTKEASQWWALYQPCNLHIGNHLGTYDQFKSLCATAARYNVKIIVDAVLNHVADNGSAGNWSDKLDPSLRNSSYYHNNPSISNYKNRWQLTQLNLGGLPDWNTQNSNVQKLHIEFLNECLNAGAGGFRFDAAKHMETSGGEDGDWSGQYWENIMCHLNNNTNKNLYSFGEVLPDLADNDEKYLSYYDITAHGYGATIRSAVRSLDVTHVKDIWHGDHTISADKSLAYVENHDDFEHDQDNAVSLTAWQRKMGYAIIAARAGITPNFLDRPLDDVWKDSEVAIINNFHNAMVGKSEFLRYPRKETLLVDRGHAGTAIINLGNEFNINCPTYLPNGTYSGAGNVFTVSNGKITGKVKGKSVLTIYNGIVHGISGNASDGND